MTKSKYNSGVPIMLSRIYKEGKKPKVSQSESLKAYWFQFLIERTHKS